MLSFIHIGKCGGTTINHLIKTKIESYKQYHLGKKYEEDTKYIIWVRNPLTRFVSAFNYQKECIDYDVTSLIDKELTVENCLAPECFKFKLLNGYAFDKEYDSLITFFKTPNYLAECLTSVNPEIKEKAITLMNFPIQHIFKGIGWFLNNGKFVINRNKDILFVGKLETMSDDIIKLQKILNIYLDINITLDNTKHLRKNTNNKNTYLSELAIKNLINWYKDTDYKALKELYRHGWITKETLASYYTYKNTF